MRPRGVEGVGSLAEGTYKVATDSDYRARTWNRAVEDAKAVGSFAETVVTDPAKAAGEVGNAASAAWNKVSDAYTQAAAEGHGSEFVGKIFGGAAVIVGTAFIPGVGEAEDAAIVGEGADAAAVLGRAGEVVADGTVGARRVEAGATDAGEATVVNPAADPLHGRTEAEFGDLASDPAHGGKIDPKSVQERRVGLDFEASGDVPGPISRDPTGAAEFIDGAGQKWDVKASTPTSLRKRADSTWFKTPARSTRASAKVRTSCSTPPRCRKPTSRRSRPRARRVAGGTG